MAVKVFAAIIIGSTETEMQIYEFSGKKNMRQVDYLSKQLSLGADAYSYGRLDIEKMQSLCLLLKEYKQIAEGYQSDLIRCCATSAFREIESAEIVQDYIEKQTNIRIEILSNSEQRFLDYKSFASESGVFDRIIQKGTAIADIGGNSIQLSVFDKDKLITTQNIRQGKVSTREELFPYARSRSHYVQIVSEQLRIELAGFSKVYQKERDIQNLIIMDNDLCELVRKLSEMGVLAESPADGISAELFMQLYQRAIGMKTDELCRQLQLSAQSAELVIQSLIFCKVLVEHTAASQIYLFDIVIGGGLAYDYGIRNKLIQQKHNFEDDILAASRHIAKRYKCPNAHSKQVEQLAGEIFVKTKKIHGLRERQLLLLRIAAILHSCGKYISLTNVSDCAYHILMASEIIGLSHDERTIVANIVKYNDQTLCSYPDWEESRLTIDDYLTMAKLTAILRTANALDKGHAGKFENAGITVKDDSIVFTVDGKNDITLEKIELARKGELFEQIFNLRPVIRIKKGKM